MAAPVISAIPKLSISGLPSITPPSLPSPLPADAGGALPAPSPGSAHLNSDTFFTWGTNNEYRMGHLASGDKWEMQRKVGDSFSTRLRVLEAQVQVVASDLVVDAGKKVGLEGAPDSGATIWGSSGAVMMSGTLKPSAGTLEIGASGARWQKGYFGSLDLSTPLGAAHGGLGLDISGAATGAIAYKTATPNVWGLLSPGTNGQVLKLAGGLPSWAADATSGGSVTSITAGDGLAGGVITSSGTLSVDSTVARTNASNVFSGSQGIGGIPDHVLDVFSNNLLGAFPPSAVAVGLRNVTASTNITAQNSPAMLFEGTVWDGFASASVTCRQAIQQVMNPAHNGFGSLRFWSQRGSGDWNIMAEFGGIDSGYLNENTFYAKTVFKESAVAAGSVGWSLETTESGVICHVITRDEDNNLYLRACAGGAEIFCVDAADDPTVLHAGAFAGDGAQITNIPTSALQTGTEGYILKIVGGIPTWVAP